jgi:hypothetical protein
MPRMCPPAVEPLATSDWRRRRILTFSAELDRTSLEVSQSLFPFRDLRGKGPYGWPYTVTTLVQLLRKSMSHLLRLVGLSLVLLFIAAVQPGIAQETTLIQPVHRTLSAQVISGTHHYHASLPIPRGKRLVVEYVSVRIVPADPTTVMEVNDVAIATTIQGVTAKHSLSNPPRKGSSDNQFSVREVFVLGQQVKLYGDGGTQVVASVELYAHEGHEQNAEIEWVISGYLVG